MFEINENIIKENCPVEINIRDISSEMIGKRFLLSGLVGKEAAPYPFVKRGAYSCLACGHISLYGLELTEPPVKPICENETCKHKMPLKLLPEESDILTIREFELFEEIGKYGGAYLQLKVFVIGQIGAHIFCEQQITLTGIISMKEAGRNRFEYVLIVDDKTDYIKTFEKKIK